MNQTQIHLILCPFLWAFTGLIYAQNSIELDTKKTASCGAKNDFAGGETNLAEWAKNYYSPRKQKTVNTKKYLPLCLHLVGNSDSSGQITASTALDYVCFINEDYQPYNIVYWIDSIDQTIFNTTWNAPPIPNVFQGITQAQADEYWTIMPTINNGQHKAANRVNLFLHGYSPGQMTMERGAYHGGAIDSNNVSGPDIVNCFDVRWNTHNRTPTHELGHYNGLPHTFHGLSGASTPWYPCVPPYYKETNSIAENYARSGVNANCATAGDRFCDTYPDYQSYDGWQPDTSGFSCPVISPDSVTFNIDGRNYMSNADLYSPRLFTQNQTDRMHDFIQTQRSNLLAVPRTGDTISQKITLIEPVNNFGEPAYPNDLAANGVDFKWHSVPNATHYILSISRANGFLPAGTKEVILTDTFYNSRKIVLNYHYYWKVRPYNKTFFCTRAQTSDVYRFSIRSYVESNTIKELNFATISPNPVTENSFSVNIDANQAFETDINLININGQIVRSWQKNHAEIGENNLQFNVYDVPNGVYIVEINTETGKKAMRMVVAK